MRTTRTSVVECPYCNATLDAASGVDNDDRPDPGDPTVCFYCGGFLRFTQNLGLEKIGLADIDNPGQRLTLMRVRMGILKARAK